MLFWPMMFHNTDKKLVTEIHHKSCFSGKIHFYDGKTFVLIIFLINNFLGTTKFGGNKRYWRGHCTQLRPVATGLLMRHEHVDTTITFSRRCKSLGRIDKKLACQVNQSEKYWKSLLQRLASVIKFIADRWSRIGVESRWWKRWIAQKQIFLKRRCDASGDRFCNSFKNR